VRSSIELLVRLRFEKAVWRKLWYSFQFLYIIIDSRSSALDVGHRPKGSPALFLCLLDD
jgi:hypothetical protein